MNAKVIQLHSGVSDERKNNQNEEIDLERACQDPLHNFTQRGRWYSIPNPIWFQLHCMLDARERLFDYIGRRTLGFRSKTTKLCPVAMPWPGNSEMAQLIGVSSGDRVSTLKRQLQRSGMIIVWKDSETKQEWVGINPALFCLPPMAARFLGRYCKEYDYKKPSTVLRRVRGDYGREDLRSLKSILYVFKDNTLKVQSHDFKSLKSDMNSHLYLYNETKKIPEPLKSLNDRLNDKRLNDRLDDRDRIGSDRDLGVEENGHEVPTQKQPHPYPDDNQSTPYQYENIDYGACQTKDSAAAPSAPAPRTDGDRLTEMVNHLKAAHKSKHPKSEVSARDRKYGFPNAARALLENSEVQRYWKFNDEGLAKRYVAFIEKLAWEKNWKNPPHGGTYASEMFMEDFIKQDEAIQGEKQREKMSVAMNRDRVGMTVP